MNGSSMPIEPTLPPERVQELRVLVRYLLTGWDHERLGSEFFYLVQSLILPEEADFQIGASLLSAAGSGYASPGSGTERARVLLGEIRSILREFVEDADSYWFEAGRPYMEVVRAWSRAFFGKEIRDHVQAPRIHPDLREDVDGLRQLFRSALRVNDFELAYEASYWLADKNEPPTAQEIHQLWSLLGNETESLFGEFASLLFCMNKFYGASRSPDKPAAVISWVKAWVLPRVLECDLYLRYRRSPWQPRSPELPPSRDSVEQFWDGVRWNKWTPDFADSPSKYGAGTWTPYDDPPGTEYEFRPGMSVMAVPSAAPREGEKKSSVWPLYVLGGLAAATIMGLWFARRM